MKRSAFWKLGRRAKAHLKLALMRYRWDRSNAHNDTTASNVFDHGKVSVGNWSYGPLRVIDGHGSSALKIGSFCSVAEDVTFILNGNHPLDHLSTFPLRTFLLGQQEEAQSKGDIVVCDDVWIGHGAVILSGVTVGRGSVVAAGSIVVSDVPPYAICAGIPARVVRMRFDPEVRESAGLLDLHAISPALVTEHSELFERPLDMDTVSALRTVLGARPDVRPTSPEDFDENEGASS